MKSIDELTAHESESNELDNNVSSDLVEKMTTAITSALKETSASNKAIADNFISAIEEKRESINEDNSESEDLENE